MSHDRTLRLSRSDRDDDSFVLVNVYRTGSKNPLDLELVASEGESAFALAIKSSHVSKYKHKASDCTDAAWEAALRNFLLLEEPQSEDLARDLRNAEWTSSITPDNHLSLVCRRNIGEVSQRLGALDLDEVDGDRFDLWQAAASAAKAFAESRQHVKDLELTSKLQEEKEQKLREQLQSLIDAKAEHEDALFHNFAELLNAKKLRIRDLQRLLSTAKVDPDQAEKVQNATPSRRPEPSRTAKRKATTRGVTSSDAESSDGFEDVQQDEEMRDGATPDGTDDESDNDAFKEVTPPPPQPKMGIRKGIGGKKANVTAGARHQSKEPPPGTSEKEDEEHLEPPPRRELPFGRGKAAERASQRMSQDAVPAPASQTKSSLSASSAPALSAGDETTDDEL